MPIYFGILGLQSSFYSNKPSHFNTVLVPFSTHHIQTNHHIMFYYPFLPLKILKVDKLTLSNLITPKHIPQGNTHIPYT